MTDVHDLKDRIKELEKRIAVRDLKLEENAIEIDYLRRQIQIYMDRAKCFLVNPLLSSPIDVDEVKLLDIETKQKFLHAVRRQMSEIEQSMVEQINERQA